MEKQKLLIFSHGWGFDKSFFMPLAKQLSNYESIILDHGYFRIAEEFYISPDPNIEYIGIGHSLGLNKLLTMEINWHKIVGISSFKNFIVNKQDKLVLENMIKAFTVNSEAVLKHFYKKCNISSWPNNTLNQAPLLSDLNNLLSINSNTNNINMLVIHAADDNIRTLQNTANEFMNDPMTKLAILDNGGHGIGFNKVKKCADLIDKFIAS